MFAIWGVVLLLTVSISEQSILDKGDIYKYALKKADVDGDIAEDAKLRTVRRYFIQNVIFAYFSENITIQKQKS